MSELDPRTPVLVGIGIVEQRQDDPGLALEPVALMIDAVRRAAADAGIAAQLHAIERVLVPQGLWSYGDPGRMIADAIGATSANTVYAKLGVMQQTLIDEACLGIGKGEFELAVVVGGEARYRGLRAQIAGIEASETANTGSPDIVMEPDAELYHDVEVAALGHMPVGYYAIMESAFRAANGWTVEQHRDRLAELYSRFSEIAAANPHAWKRDALAPEAIRNASAKNKMLAFPYTKLHNSSWNVDQAAALLLCSVEQAEALGIPRSQWVFPLASAESNYMLSLAQKRELHRLPGARVAGQQALSLAGLTVAELDFIELYSCFPIAVEIYAAELGLPDTIDWTVTGGMPFAGGPLNNFVFQSTARMVEMLRQSPGSNALISSVSGLMTKQSFAVWSSAGAARGFQFEDVTEAVRAEFGACDIAENYRGEGCILGYTVLYQGEQAQRAVVVVEVPGGAHTVAFNEDPALMAAMQLDEYCGRSVTIEDNRFTLAAGHAI
jgi:acetyl-CoA C-acetyltransferase